MCIFAMQWQTRAEWKWDLDRNREREKDEDSEKKREIGQNEPNSIKTISHKISGAYENCLPMWQVDSIIRYN